MNNKNIPEKMRAIQLQAYNRNIIRVLLSLKVTEINVPKPEAEQVLIKMQAAPCNPSDIAFMRGGYNIKKDLPKVLGFEGSGTVVFAGRNPKAQELIGKRVSCFTQENEHGTWAEYFVTNYKNCLPIKDEMDIEQAACFFVNPFTAYGLVDYAEKRNSKTIIQNAAAGQIGDFIQKLAKEKGIKIINIVRKDEHIDELTQLGEKYVINMSEENFETQLKELAHNLNATTAFDAVGGEGSGQIFNAMNQDSQLVVYGGLSGKAVTNIDEMDLIFKNKSIKGFNLSDWIKETDKENFNKISAELQDSIINSEIKTKIQGTIKLEEVVAGLRQYISNMSAGKIVFEL